MKKLLLLLGILFAGNAVADKKAYLKKITPTRAERKAARLKAKEKG
mgnify:CR=1 FL=1